MAHPAVSVVVPCRNEVACVEKCLRSILQQEPPPGGMELIVADGMSDDGTRNALQRIAAADPRVRVVDNPRRITPCGMNAAIQAAHGQWIAIMGAHNRYANDYLVRCLEVAQATRADNVGGAMIAEGRTWVQKAVAAAHHSTFATGGARWHNPDYEGLCDTVFGGFYRREVFERIGLFDEELVRNQDDELNLRLLRSGGKIWHSPKTRSWYCPRKSLGAIFCRCKEDGYWKVRVIQKHKLPASWRHLVPGAFVFTLLLLGLVAGLSPWTSPLSPNLRYLNRLALWALGSVVGLYAAAAVLAALATARKYGWRLLPLLPPIFTCYHVGYGWGFLRGIWDFFIRGKRPRRPGPELTGRAGPGTPAGH